MDMVKLRRGSVRGRRLVVGLVGIAVAVVPSLTVAETARAVQGGVSVTTVVAAKPKTVPVTSVATGPTIVPAGKVASDTTWTAEGSPYVIDGEVWVPEGVRARQHRLPDHAGTATTSAGDATITRAYDPLGRLTGIDYSDNTPDATYTYDELHLRSMADGIAPGPETYGYDALGQLKSVTRGATGFTYDYDETGNLTSRTQPNGATVTQVWNNDGLPTTLASGDVQATYGYDPAGNLTQVTRGNGTTDTLAYGQTGWVTSVDSLRGNTIVATHDYTYDNVGNPLHIHREFSGLLTPKVNEYYTYDDANRLTKVCYASNCNQRREYTYDAVGNRLTENRVGGDTTGLITLSYNTKDQLTQTSRPRGLLQPPEVITYDYDTNGNQTQAGTRTTGYDLANRPTSTTEAGSTTGYSYDGNGTRLTSTAAGTTTNYTWDLNNPLPELVAETTGTSTQGFVNDPAGDPIATIVPPSSSGSTGIHYLHADALGSIHAATDNGGAVRASYAYEPFGSDRPSPTNQDNVTNPIGFTGEHQDPATGLYHLRARDYDTTTGRFTALDPVTQDVRNPYVAEYLYANNQPTVHTDPSGQCLIVCGAAGAVIGGLAGGIHYAATTDDFSFGGLASSSGKAALVGAVVGGTGGLATSAISGAGYSSLSAVVGGGAVGGFHGSYANAAIYEHRLPTHGEVAGWTALSAGTAGAGYGLLKGLSTALCKIRSTQPRPTTPPPATAPQSAANAAPKALNASTRVAPWAGPSLSRLSREGEVMYRVYGGGAGKAGSWITPIKPTSSAAARQGLALPAENAALYVSKVTLPGGVRMQVGTAGSAFGQPGGWAQAQLLERIPLSSFGKGVPLQ